MSNQQNSSIDVSPIRDALLQNSERSITGAQLHAMIQKLAPSINVREATGIIVGPGALSKFVETYLGDTLTNIGFRGGDKLYGIAGFEGARQVDMSGGGVWKSFVSSQSPYDLLVDVEQLELRSVPHGEPRGNFKKLEKVSFEEHDAIRAEFHEDLEFGGLSGEKLTIKPSDDYSHWIGILKETSPGIFKKWGKFRRDKLISIFQSRLEGLGVSKDGCEKLVRELTIAQRDARKPVDRDNNNRSIKNDQKWLSESQLVSRQEVSIAQLAQRSVSNLSESDLRSLKLPLGAVFDALVRSNAN